MAGLLFGVAGVVLTDVRTKLKYSMHSLLLFYLLKGKGLEENRIKKKLKIGNKKLKV